MTPAGADRRVILIALSLAIATGAYAVDATRDREAGFGRYLRTAPAAESLSGRWGAQPQSLGALRGHGFAIDTAERHTLELLPSGACRFRSHWQYSYVDADEPEASVYYDTDTCRWTLGAAQARVGSVSFDAAAVSLDVRQGERQSFAVYYVADHDGRLVLWQSIGEPREGLYMDFVRQAAAR